MHNLLTCQNWYYYRLVREQYISSVCHWDQLKPSMIFHRYRSTQILPPSTIYGSTVRILVSVAFITTCIVCSMWNIFHMVSIAEYQGNTEYIHVHNTQGIILPPRSCTLSNSTLNITELPHNSLPLSWFFLQCMFFLLLVSYSTLLLLVTIGFCVSIPLYVPTVFINTLGLIYFFGLNYSITG